MGNNEKAVESFLKVITSNPDSVYARHSNRQLYIIGTSLGGSNNIREISKVINLKLKDPLFEQMAEHHNGSLKNLNMGIESIDVVIPEKVAEGLKNINVKSDKNKEVYLTIITNDGNRFIGRLLEKSGSHISIQTSIGRVDVSREKIVEVLENK